MWWHAHRIASPHVIEAECSRGLRVLLIEARSYRQPLQVNPGLGCRLATATATAGSGGARACGGCACGTCAVGAAVYAAGTAVSAFGAAGFMRCEQTFSMCRSNLHELGLLHAIAVVYAVLLAEGLEVLDAPVVHREPNAVEPNAVSSCGSTKKFSKSWRALLANRCGHAMRAPGTGDLLSPLVGQDLPRWDGLERSVSLESTNEAYLAIPPYARARFQIVGGRLWKAPSRCVYRRDETTAWAILQMLARHPDQPDVDVVFNCRDGPLLLRNWRTRAKQRPMVFSYSTDELHSEVAFPDYTLWGLPGKLKPWPQLRLDLLHRAQTPWAGKQARYLPPTPYYLLPAACYLLRTAYYHLLVGVPTYSPLPTTYHVPPTYSRSLCSSGPAWSTPTTPRSACARASGYARAPTGRGSSCTFTGCTTSASTRPRSTAAIGACCSRLVRVSGQRVRVS